MSRLTRRGFQVSKAALHVTRVKPLRIHGEEWFPYPGKRLVNRCGVVIFIGKGSYAG